MKITPYSPNRETAFAEACEVTGFSRLAVRKRAGAGGREPNRAAGLSEPIPSGLVERRASAQGGGHEFRQSGQGDRSSSLTAH